MTTASPAAEAAIATTELTKRYGRTIALAGLSMRVERGEVFGFLGPNGAGKTTAVKLLLGLTRPTGGSGRLLGAPLGDRRADATADRHRRFGDRHCDGIRQRAAGVR